MVKITLGLLGWINGLLSMTSVIFALTVGGFFIYKAKKANAKLLAWAGLMIMLIWTYYLGTSLDFIMVLLTGNNIDNTSRLLGSLNLMWPALGSPVQVYFTAELIIPEKKLLKRIVTYSYLIIMMTALLFLFFSPSASFVYYYPINSGEDLIYFRFNYASPVSILFFFSIFYIIIFVVVGFLIKSFHSKGILRKKYLYSSMAVLTCTICKMLEVSFYLGIVSIFTKSADLIGGVLWYLSLREASAEPKKKPEKKIQVEEGIFRLTERPDHITEEEVIFHKEKKICLVCKGKALNFIYVCPECEALYCENCVRTLENLENSCWICNRPFNESKPSKPFKIKDKNLDPKLLDSMNKLPKIE